MYAIIETGGKQYKVAEGDILRVELLKAEEASEMEINKVIAVEKEGKLEFGKPYLEGVRYSVKFLATAKAKK